MSALRKRMIQDMQLRGFSPRTQESYARAVRKLAEHYHKSPRSDAPSHASTCSAIASA